MMFGVRVALAGIAAVLTLGLAPAPGVAASPPSTGPLLLADDTVTPRATLRWTQADGTLVEHQLDLPYASDDERTTLGHNLEAFVALGGSRLERGAGHPDGAIVRLGLWKVDRDRLMFEDIAHGSDIEVELRHVKFNQDVTPDNATLLQRLKYKVDDILACGLTIDQTEMFNMASPDDNMGGSILPTQVRHDCLRGANAEDGHATVWVEDDGTVSMRAVVPYRLLRHIADPWRLDVPGTFFEPYEFDLEFEVLPLDVAEAEGVERLLAPPDAATPGVAARCIPPPRAGDPTFPDLRTDFARIPRSLS